MLFAISLPFVVGMCALGVEVAYWQLEKARLQALADSSVYAAAIEARGGAALPAIQTAASQAAHATYNWVGKVEVNTPPKSGPNMNSNAVEVILSRDISRYFSAIFRPMPVHLTARAVAGFAPGANACVLATHPSAPQAALFSGNSSLTVKGCYIHANSAATGAIHAQGSTALKVDCLSTVGTYTKGGNPSVTQGCGSALTGQAPAADPYGAVPEPPVSGSCASTGGNALQPGRYCSGLSINGNVSKTLASGVYVMEGPLSFNGNSTVTSLPGGVTFFMTNNSSVTINGNVTLNLQAPTTGPYAGILFFGSRSNSSSTAVTINGSASSVATGSMYFPNQTISFKGNFSGQGGCMQMVSAKVDWTGSSTIAFDCTAYGIKPIVTSGIVRLRE